MFKAVGQDVFKKDVSGKFPQPGQLFPILENAVDMMNQEIGLDVLKVVFRVSAIGQEVEVTDGDVQHFAEVIGFSRGVVYFLLKAVDFPSRQRVVAGHVLDKETGGLKFETVGRSVRIVVEHFLQFGTILASQTEGMTEFVVLKRTGKCQ